MSKWGEVVLPEGWRLVVLDEAGSTNDEVRARRNEKEGLVVLAENQTAGRGRRGAAWLSVAGESLTFSVLLRPDEPKALWPRLSLAAGLAVADSLERVGLDARIKWPNDVLVGGRKICGILVDAGPDYVVVGIGLNVGSGSFPNHLEATSVFLESGLEIEREEILSLILRSLNGWSREIGTAFPELIGSVRERCALSGERVRLMSGERQIEGRVLEIGAGGELVVETDQGVERFLQAHEVRCLD